MSDSSGKGKERLGDVKPEAPDQTEEQQFGTSLEQYLANADPHRATSMRDPWPYPLTLHHAPHLSERIFPLLNEIRNILNSHELPGSVQFLPYVVTKPQYPGGDIPLNLLRVVLQAEHGVSIQLDAVKDDLLGLLHLRGIQDMHVEVVNIDLCFGPSIFPILPQHPILTIFENTKDQVIEILNNNLGSKWNVLCPFAVGRSEQNARPAIVIHVDPMTSADWPNLVAQVEDKVTNPKYPQKFSIEVNFFPGDLFLLQSKEVSFVDRITPDGPAMGHSIGIAGERNVGTLGGYVTLIHNGKAHKGLLTNYHVVRPSDLSLEIEEGLDRFGCLPSQPLERTIQMESLAVMDIDATELDIDDKMKFMNLQADNLSNKIEARAQAGARPLPAQQKTLEQCEIAIQELKTKRQILEEMPYLMGEVTVISGKALMGRKLMDWAFVRLNETTAETFFKPNLMFPVPPDQMPWMYSPDLGLPVPEGTPLLEFGDLKEGTFYYKSGRSTGVTAGICNGTLACCNWEGKDRVRFQHDGQQVDLSSNVTEEFVIVNKKRGNAKHQQTSFAETGDSGSFVINNSGQICGLLYGATSGLYGPPNQPHSYINAGLAIDFDVLSESLKLRTMTKDASGNIITPPAELSLPGDY